MRMIQAFRCGSSLLRERKARLACAPILALTLVVLFSGCSAVQQGSTPFWEEEYQRKYYESSVHQYGPNAIEKSEAGVPASVYAGRINGWPLFYRLGDAMSVLWPLYMKTPLGSAVFPLFEHIKEPMRLSFLLYTIGIYSDAAKDRSGNYVFPVWIYHRKGDGKTGHVMLLGGWHSSRSDSGHWLFPVWKYKARGVGHGKEFRFLLVAGAESSSGTLENYTFPIWRYRSLGNGKDRLFHYLLFGGVETSPNRLSHYFFPAYGYERTGDSRSFLSIPLFISDEANEKDRVAGLLLYWDFLHGKNRYRSLFWPLTHFWKSDHSKGHLIAPLYGWTRYDDGGWMFNSLLLNRMKGKTNVLNVGGPLFFHATRDNGWYTNLFWPIYQGWGSKDTTSHLLLPVGYYHENKEKESAYLNVLGLLLNRWKTKDHHGTVSPLVSWGGNKDGEGFLNVMALLFHRQWDKDGYYAWLTPLLGLSKDADDHARWMFPLFIQENGTHDHGFYSPLFSYNKSKDELWWNTLLAGPTYYSDKTTKSYSCFMGIIHYFLDTDKGRCFNMSFILPIFCMDRHGYQTTISGYRNEIPPEPEIDAALTKNLDGMEQKCTQWQADEDKRIAEQKEKGEPYTTQTLPGWYAQTSWQKEKSAHFTPLITGWRKEKFTAKRGDSLEQFKASRKTERFFTVFPLYFLWGKSDVRGERESGANLLGILYMGNKKRVEKDGVTQTHVRRRVLYKFLDYRRQGEMSVMDAFPFMTWDRDPSREYRRFSFLGPVLRRTARSGKTQWQILGIKAGDDLSVDSAVLQ
jgi:hypothetical protein